MVENQVGVLTYEVRMIAVAVTGMVPRGEIAHEDDAKAQARHHVRLAVIAKADYEGVLGSRRCLPLVPDPEPNGNTLGPHELEWES